MSKFFKTAVNLDHYCSEFGEEKWLEDVLKEEATESKSEETTKKLKEDQFFSAKLLKIKVIALDLLNFDLCTDPKDLCPRDKQKIERTMLEWALKPDKEVDSEFNSIVNGKLLL